MKGQGEESRNKQRNRATARQRERDDAPVKERGIRKKGETEKDQAIYLQIYTHRERLKEKCKQRERSEITGIDRNSRNREGLTQI